jgi:hypothetical protein
MKSYKKAKNLNLKLKMLKQHMPIQPPVQWVPGVVPKSKVARVWR